MRILALGIGAGLALVGMGLGVHAHVGPPAAPEAWTLTARGGVLVSTDGLTWQAATGSLPAAGEVHVRTRATGWATLARGSCRVVLQPKSRFTALAQERVGLEAEVVEGTLHVDTRGEEVRLLGLPGQVVASEDGEFSLTVATRAASSRLSVDRGDVDLTSGPETVRVPTGPSLESSLGDEA